MYGKEDSPLPEIPNTQKPGESHTAPSTKYDSGGRMKRLLSENLNLIGSRR